MRNSGSYIDQLVLHLDEWREVSRRVSSESSRGIALKKYNMLADNIFNSKYFKLGLGGISSIVLQENVFM